MKISRSQTITLLVNEKAKKLTKWQQTLKKRKVICSVCNGNGFVRVPYEQVREEQWANCDFCNSQGEVEVEEDDTIRKIQH